MTTTTAQMQHADSIYTNDVMLIEYLYTLIREIDIDIASLKAKLDTIIICITNENISIIKRHYLQLKRVEIKKLAKKIKHFEELKSRIDFMSEVIPNIYLGDLSQTLDVVHNEIKRWDSIICNDVNLIIKKCNGEEYDDYNKILNQDMFGFEI